MNRLSIQRGAEFANKNAASIGSAAPWWEIPVPPRLAVEEATRRLEEGSLRRGVLIEYRGSWIGVDDLGSGFVVFPDDRVCGSEDFWFYSLQAKNPVLLVGVLERPHRARLSVRFDGSYVTVIWVFGPERLNCPQEEAPQPVVLSFADLQRDSDGDTLPDVVEKLLFLDATSADSDLDGRADHIDRSPNGGWAPPPNAVESIAVGLVADLWQPFRSRCPRCCPVFVVSESPIEWTNTCVTTINIRSAQVNALRDGTDVWAIYPGVSDGHHNEEFLADIMSSRYVWWMEPLRPQGYRLLLTVDHIGIDSEGYDIRLRPHGGGWLTVWEDTIWY